MSPPSPDSTPLVDTSPRSLGRFSVGPVAIGTWRLTDPEFSVGTSLIGRGLELGFNLVDTADVYGLDWGGTGFGSCEEHVGRVLAANPSMRDDIVLATKGGIIPGVPYNSSRSYLRAAVDASLTRLRTDRIDLYQIHRPDPLTSPAEVASAMVELREQGKVLEFGVSNYTPSQFAALQHHLPFPLVSTQPQFSAAFLDPMFDGTFDQCLTLGVVPLAWSPLGGGDLGAGGEETGTRTDLVSVLDELARREATDRATIALAFVLSHPSRPIPILGTTKPDRVSQAADAGQVHLERADCYRLVEASIGEKLP
ncbi:MAG: aldo/keto reductase [Acidimicrobiia bacterium]|nr:aldo/keto reductase [Acidimicrobiia bacterium]